MRSPFIKKVSTKGTNYDKGNKEPQRLKTYKKKKCSLRVLKSFTITPTGTIYRKNMKKIICTTACLLMSALPLQATQTDQTGAIDWSVKQKWNLQAEPLDFVQSLDNKKVFVLGADSKVYVYTPEGKQLGSIPVDKSVTAIDIAPRGESLYLISKTAKTYTALDISVTQAIDITGAPFVGNENAPVTLVVFSDFQ